MLKNYLTTALRNVRREKGYAFINVAGLAVGLACSFFILLWVTNEMKFDRFHADGDRLYRVMRHGYLSDNVYTWESMPKPLADALEADYPEVEDAVLMTWQQDQLITYDDDTFRREGYQAAPSFFEAFTFPLLLGDPETVLQDPQAIVISEGLAATLFGPGWQAEGDVLGRTIRVDQEKDFQITGVFEDVPDHSTLQFDFVLPVAEFIQRNDWVENWGSAGMQLFVRLQPGTDHEAFNRKIANLIRENKGFANAMPFVHPYTDMHLHSEFRDGKLVGGRITYVRIFTLVSIFLLLIACINFMNLATARSAKRAREVGVRKAVGATQTSLVRQFMAESMFTVAFSFVAACVLVVALLPVFNELTGQALTLGDLDLRFAGLMLGVAVLTGIISGTYPAFYLSSFSAITVLKGTFRQRPAAGTLRKGLVVFQFALSTLLIVGTLAIYAQVQYIRNIDLGMDHDNLIYMEMEGNVADQFEAFRQELRAQPGIAQITTSSQNPLDVGNNTTAPTWPGKTEDDNTLFYIINANYDFVETMEMEMAAGRSFSRAFASDTANFLINEQAAKAMGLEDPVGTPLSMWGRDGHIVGVVEDFIMSSLHQAIEPTVIRLVPEDTGLLFVRPEEGRTTEALAGLEAVHARFNPGYPFDYGFLDEVYEQAYESEIVMGRLANAFALIAILTSCLGLFGLSSFTAEQRRKEIGVRKVLGASAAGLVLLLSKDFLKLVAIAFLLAAPLAYYLAQNWLDGFAYRVQLNPGIFLLAGVAALLIALLTVSYQALKAAVADPVRSLRYE